jgi:DNA-binding NtrC family response regulator
MMEMTTETNGVEQRIRRDLKSMLDEYERTLILQALSAAAGHQRRAAAVLGILPTTLHEKMKRLGIRTRTGILRPEATQATSAGSEAA